MRKILIKGGYEKVSKIFAIFDYIVEKFGHEREKELFEKVDIEEIEGKLYGFYIPCELEKFFYEALGIYEGYEKHGVLMIRNVACIFKPHPFCEEWIVEEKWKN